MARLHKPDNLKFSFNHSCPMTEETGEKLRVLAEHREHFIAAVIRKAVDAYLARPEIKKEISDYLARQKEKEAV